MNRLSLEKRSQILGMLVEGNSLRATARMSDVSYNSVLPPEYLRSQSALMRLWIGSMLRACVKGGAGEHNKVHFVLDEAASLGRLEVLDDAVDKYRGYGVRLMFFYQSIGQLKRCRGNPVCFVKTTA